MKKRYVFLVLALLSVSFAFAITTNAIQGATPSDVSIQVLRFYYSLFDGSTSDFNSYSFETLQNFSSAILEKTSFGKVSFLDNLNFSLVGGEDKAVDFDSYFNISDNLVYANPLYLPYINKSAIVSLYGLTFSNPVIINGVINCTTCEIISYSGGTLVFNTTLFEGPFYASEGGAVGPVCGNGVCESGETTSSCPADCEEDTGDTGGDTGDVTTPPSDSDEPAEGLLEVDPELLVVQMNKGEYYPKTVTVYNQGTRSLDVTVYLIGNISKYLFPDNRTFTLDPGESKDLRYDIYFSRTTPSDVYVGEALFSSSGTSFTQKIILDIQDKDALFDIRAEVLKRYLFPGARARANITIINMGDLRNFDVSLEYKIIDYEENVYSSKKEDFAINQTYSNVFFLDLPEDIEIGDYLFYAKVIYPETNVSASAYDTITVEVISFWTWLLLILIIILIGFYVYYRYKKYGKKKVFLKKVETEKRKSELKKAGISSEYSKAVPKLPDDFD